MSVAAQYAMRAGQRFLLFLTSNAGHLQSIHQNALEQSRMRYAATIAWVLLLSLFAFMLVA